MIVPQINDHVVLFLKSTLQLEGIVYAWGDQVAIISSETKDLVVINDPSEILVFKICSPKQKAVQKPEVKAQAKPIAPLDDRIQKMVDVKKAKIEEDKKYVAQLLRKPPQVGNPQYVIPNITKPRTQ